jgi:hypothetical protein
MYVDEEERGKQRKERKRKGRRTKMYDCARYTDHNKKVNVFI